MLDVVYYPVSAVLWLWHTAFAALLGPGSGLAWVLAVVFLVATLRAAMYPLFLKQVRTQAIVRRLQPQVEALRKRYPDDRQRQAAEIQQLHRKHGVRVLAGCLPMLGQGLVFLALFHVLRSFDRTGTLGHLPFQSTPTPMTPEQNAQTPNYVFDAADVQSFLRADLFGAPLSNTLAGQPSVAIAAVAGTLMVLAALATHFTARASIARQDPAVAQVPMLNTLTLWVFPAGVFVGGAVLPVAILLYWVSNNAWTLAQQHFTYRWIDTETRSTATVSATSATANTPRPGVKPKSRRRR
ncbi:YidC/Oxa1 family membrane protein insertase [Nocardia amikacinitolerans]|uniref:membrane protein insertase YidC n=1 Tax=Nocardia amikacinitolerans TaxID=756689 RepID=UPI0020A46218|nr:membrane protein insertase YidC [Nocardia amikacinitolerans]MCP2297727.1 YidC/Oxa1 family membrane protein insertase [Nocardia amikacinitolerans]